VYAALLLDRTEVIIKSSAQHRAHDETDLAILLTGAAGQGAPGDGLRHGSGGTRSRSLPNRCAARWTTGARAHADRFRANFAKETHSTSQGVLEYTTKRVMVQERIYGIKINDYPDAGGRRL